MGVDAATPPGFWERIRQIVRDEIAKLLRSGLLRSASIGEGGLTLRGGFLRLLFGDREVFYIGPVAPASTDGTPQQGWIVRRADGTSVLDLYDAIPGTGANPFNQALNWRDRGGNIVFADDTDSGQGMARPYIGGQFHARQFANWSYTVTATEWTTVAQAFVFKQQPQLSVGVRAGMDTTGTTGEVRVLVENVQLGPITSEGFATANRYFTGPVAGAHMEILTVEIQGRRTSATGALRLEPIYWMGRQS